MLTKPKPPIIPHVLNKPIPESFNIGFVYDFTLSRELRHQRLIKFIKPFLGELQKHFPKKATNETWVVGLSCRANDSRILLFKATDFTEEDWQTLVVQHFLEAYAVISAQVFYNFYQPWSPLRAGERFYMIGSAWGDEFGIWDQPANYQEVKLPTVFD